MPARRTIPDLVAAAGSAPGTLRRTILTVFRHAAMLAWLPLLPLAGCSRDRNVIVVGSKNFTEQVILGELLAISDNVGIIIYMTVAVIILSTGD